MAADDPIWQTPYREFRMPVGLPRPIWNGIPVPFTSEVRAGGAGTEPAFPQASSALAACIVNARCMVCGEQIEGECAVVFDNEECGIVDGGGMHVRCARLAAAHCPDIREKLQTGEYRLQIGPFDELVPQPYQPAEAADDLAAVGD